MFVYFALRVQRSSPASPRPGAAPTFSYSPPSLGGAKKGGRAKAELGGARPFSAPSFRAYLFFRSFLDALYEKIGTPHSPVDVLTIQFIQFSPQSSGSFQTSVRYVSGF